MAAAPAPGRWRVGCYLSHLRLLEHIASHETGWVCVLEDDLIFDDDFHDVVDAGASLPSQGGVIKLDGPLGRGTQICIELSPLGRRRLVVPLKPQLSAGGYLVHAGVAEKLVARLSVISQPFDHVHYRYWRHGVPVYAVSPYPVRQVHILSKIRPQQRLVRGDALTPKSFKFRVCHEFLNLTETLQRVFAAVKLFGPRLFKARRIDLKGDLG